MVGESDCRWEDASGNGKHPLFAFIGIAGLQRAVYSKGEREEGALLTPWGFEGWSIGRSEGARQFFPPRNEDPSSHSTLSHLSLTLSPTAPVPRHARAPCPSMTEYPAAKASSIIGETVSVRRGNALFARQSPEVQRRR